MNQSETGQHRIFVEPEIYYAQLAAVHVATGALITDPSGRVLLVKPNYRPHWLLPGGMADDGEPPEVACARELDGLGIRLQHAELDDAAFFEPDEAAARLAMGVAARVPAALAARERGITVYRPAGG